MVKLLRMGKANRNYKMNILHVSTERFHSSAILVAVLFLAIPEGCFCSKSTPKVYTYGVQQPGDMRYSRHISMTASAFGKAIYKTTLNLKYEIHFIKFLDYARNRPDIWLSKHPPCYNPEIVIRAPHKDKIDMQMEIYVANPKNG